MSTILIHGIGAGLLLGLTCGDAGKDSAQAKASAPAGPSRAFAQVDACALLTKAEAEAIVGQTIGPPTKGGSGECHYGEEGSSGEIIVYPMMLGFRSQEEFRAFVKKDTEEMNQRMKEGLQGTGATVKETAVEPVPQVGDAAYYVDPSLIVLSHQRVLNITAGNREQAFADISDEVFPGV